MLTFSTAGESHGRGVFALLDGIPAGAAREDESDSCECGALGSRSAGRSGLLAAMVALFLEPARPED